uniref:EGF-like domain-containing protein n=1 Tax=Megaselia scalaris TaxID=36166 RepID=T1GK47_MEGSC
MTPFLECFTNRKLDDFFKILLSNWILWDNCDKACRCKNNSSCDPKTGECICSIGWTGNDCSEPCPFGTFGAGCKEKCQDIVHVF